MFEHVYLTLLRQLSEQHQFNPAKDLQDGGVVGDRVWTTAGELSAVFLATSALTRALWISLRCAGR